MALGSRIGSLYVRVGADTRQFHREMRRVNSPLERFRTVAGTAIKSFAAIGAAATAASVGIYALARSEMNLIDEQAKLARSIGGTVTGLRTLKLAAEDNGIDGLEGSLNRLNRRLGAVEMGGGPAAETVKRLGLNIKELSEMDIDDRLATIADRIRDYGGSSQESARHLQQLGFQQKEAVTFFEQGGDAIRAARDEIKAFGLSVSMLDAARIEEANTQLSRMSLVAQGLRTQLAVALAPTLLELAQRFANVARAMLSATQKSDELGEAADDLGSNQSIVDFAYESGLAIANLVDTLNKAVRGFNVVTTSFKAAWNDIRVILANQARDTTGISKLFNPEEFQRREEEYAQVLQDQAESLKETEDARRAFSEAGSFFADAFQEGWARTLETITVTPPDRGGEGGGDVLGLGGGDTDERMQEELERRREMLEQRLQMLREFVAEEMELEIFQHEQKLEQLRELWEEGIIPTEEEFMELREQLEEDHWDRIDQIRKKSQEEHIRNVQRAAQMENQLRQGVAQHAIGLLDQLAGKSKAAAIASIALNKVVALQRLAQTTAEASMLAYASQLVPGDPSSVGRAAAAAAKAKALGAIQAGLIVATGIAQIAGATSSQSSLRGGASGSIGGHSSAPSSTAPSASDTYRERTVATINLVGEVFNRQQVRELIEHINEATKDGAVLRLN